MVEKQCPVCREKFYARSQHQVYCGKKCYRDAQRFFYIELCNKKAERNKKAIFSDEGIAKLWDPNDPECKDTMAFIRTIKPIF